MRANWPKLELFTVRFGLGLELPDTVTELVVLEKFGPESHPINGRVGSVWVEFGWGRVGLGEICEF